MQKMLHVVYFELIEGKLEFPTGSVQKPYFKQQRFSCLEQVYHLRFFINLLQNYKRSSRMETNIQKPKIPKNVTYDREKRLAFCMYGRLLGRKNRARSPKTTHNYLKNCPKLHESSSPLLFERSLPLIYITVVQIKIPT